MTKDERDFYIDWLVIRYPRKTRSYFAAFSDEELIAEHERGMTE